MPRTSDPDRRVVVTGQGCVSPLGVDLDETWAAAVAGHSGIGPITLIDVDPLPVGIAGEVTGEVVLRDVAPKEERRMARFVKFAIAASQEAVRRADLDLEEIDRDRVGVSIGSGVGGLGTILDNHDTLYASGARRVSPFTIPMGISNMASGMVSIQLGLRGPNLCYVSACASGNHAIGEAAEIIARGDADVMLAGGSEACILGVTVSGFASMRALSKAQEPETASRPFDRARDGFVLGEGAAALVLESVAHAKRRGANILAEVRGYAATGDGFHLSAPDEQGRGAVRCMRGALEDAGLGPEAIDYVNAHATSTPTGDVSEARALHEVFGERIAELPVSATKSMTGHLLGAAGALEAIFCVRTIETGLILPTINLDDPDPECSLDHVAHEARAHETRICLSNSFGFGGTNAALVLGRFED